MNKKMLDELEIKITNILLGKVKNIIDKTRKKMIIIEEKQDGDSATIADIEIGKIFKKVH